MLNNDEKSNEETTNNIVVVYDEMCPFCRSYVKHTRLKKQFEQVQLINAREDHANTNNLRAQGYDLNEGMIVQHHGTTYYGPDAMHQLALLTTRSDFFNWAVSRVMSNQGLSRGIYPILKVFRKMTLRILGRQEF